MKVQIDERPTEGQGPARYAANGAAGPGRHGPHPIVVAGLLAGALDICAAFVLTSVRGGSPLGMLRGIASGLLGAAAFTGGAATAVLGLLLHFVIATGAAAVFYLASRRWRALLRNPVVAGVLYGPLVYLVMNQVVLPLSRVQVRAQAWSIIGIMVAIHVLFVGLPIALTVARMSRRPGRDGATPS